jgi:hypothetical protein
MITWAVRGLRSQVWASDVTVRALGCVGGEVLVEHYRDGWSRAVAWGRWQPYGQAHEQELKQGEARELGASRRGQLAHALLDAILGRIADLAGQEFHLSERDRARYTAERTIWMDQLDALADGSLAIAVLERDTCGEWQEIERLEPVGLVMRIEAVRREELERRQAAQEGEE